MFVGFKSCKELSKKLEKNLLLHFIRKTSNALKRRFLFQFSIRFNESQTGLYYLYFHSCFDYRNHGVSNRVAVDLTVNENTNLKF